MINRITTPHFIQAGGKWTEITEETPIPEGFDPVQELEIDVIEDEFYDKTGIPLMEGLTGPCEIREMTKNRGEDWGIAVFPKEQRNDEIDEAAGYLPPAGADR